VAVNGGAGMKGTKDGIVVHKISRPTQGQGSRLRAVKKMSITSGWFEKKGRENT